MIDENICFATHNNKCSILCSTICNGYDEKCKFKKTSKQYVNDNTRALNLLKAKGLVSVEQDGRRIVEAI